MRWPKNSISLLTFQCNFRLFNEILDFSSKFQSHMWGTYILTFSVNTSCASPMNINFQLIVLHAYLDDRSAYNVRSVASTSNCQHLRLLFLVCDQRRDVGSDWNQAIVNLIGYIKCCTQTHHNHVMSYVTTMIWAYRVSRGEHVMSMLRAFKHYPDFTSGEHVMSMLCAFKTWAM